MPALWTCRLAFLAATHPPLEEGKKKKMKVLRLTGQLTYGVLTPS